jgi:hypothetical protein
MDKFNKLKNKSQRIYELSKLLQNQTGIKKWHSFKILSNKYNRAIPTIYLHYRKGCEQHKNKIMDNLIKLFEKIECTNFNHLLNWYKENDDAFFDFFYQQMEDGHINREEFNLIMLLVGEDGKV